MNDKVNKKLLKLSGICAIILVAALVVVGVFELLVNHYKNKLEYLDAGKRWSADGERYVCRRGKCGFIGSGSVMGEFNGFLTAQVLCNSE